MTQQDAAPPPGPRRAHAGLQRRDAGAVLLRTYNGIISDRIGLAAAGCAFWATLALFPAIGMLVSLYGLVFDPQTVEPQLAILHGLLPPAAYALIADRVHVLVSHGSTTLQLSLVITSAIALWSSSTGTKSMVSALNQAYSSSESRNFFVFQLIGLLLTLGAIMAALIGLVILIGLPPLIQFIGLSDYSAGLVRLGSLAVLVLFVLLALAVLYRVGPSRRKAQWQWFTPGALLATLGWLIASVLVSYYVGNLATYDATYGPLGAVAGVMMWFYVSAYVVLAGAELNAALEAVAARR